MEEKTNLASTGGEYTVVARRYRPQLFEDLVGQSSISQALCNAIATNRVGHAYLFTGARGTGKTSTARIFCKALCCVQGPTATPCNTCDICRGISRGDDIDVLEIDGASNRGIDEIRQLRANVNIRPSRARFKVYIIDEVHMLTAPAFNALLKTLEEPPPHVKFVFCTTDPEKMPITVLSRCQRYDFAPVARGEIVKRLAAIVETEGRVAEAEALEILGQRAAGSMRDSQSLLEQLLAFGGERITVDDVHRMLGTARGGRLRDLLAKILAREAAGALAELDAALAEGVEPGAVAEQLLGSLRDLLAAAVGCEPRVLLSVATGEYEEFRRTAVRVGLENLLAMLQILDQTLVRMRQSVHARTLLEIALVRICRLDDLNDLASLVDELRSGPGASGQSPARPAAGGSGTGAPSGAMPRAVPGGSGPASLRQMATPPVESHLPSGSEATAGQPPAPHFQPADEVPSPDASPTEGSRVALKRETLAEVWRLVLESLGDMTADYASQCDRLELPAPQTLVISFQSKHSLAKQFCESPDRRARIEGTLRELTGERVAVQFNVVPDRETPAAAPAAPVVSSRQLQHQAAGHPFVKRAAALFSAEIMFVEPARAVAAAASASAEPEGS